MREKVWFRRPFPPFGAVRRPTTGCIWDPVFSTA
jgi:hypothetical protein